MVKKKIDQPVFGLSVLNNLIYTMFMIISLGIGMGITISLFSLFPTLSLHLSSSVSYSEKIWTYLSIAGSLLIIIIAVSLLIPRF